jgi:hypothetical protein
MSDPDTARLCHVFREFYSWNRNRFALAPRWEEGREKEIVVDVTFLRGERYCCFEACCVLGLCDERWWMKLRAALNKYGLGDRWPVTVEFRVRVEEGAMHGWPKPWPYDEEMTYRPSPAYEYTYGPHQEGVEEELE